MIQKREAMMNLQNAIKDEEKSPTQPHEIPNIQQMSVSRSRKKEKSIERGSTLIPCVQTGLRRKKIFCKFLKNLLTKCKKKSFKKRQKSGHILLIKN
jgi:hypothetical protein